MALNGRLETIPLAEVIRMLARSNKTGCLRVEAGSMEGKVYLRDGELLYATTRRDDDLRSDLLNAGYVDPEDWQLVERREKAIGDVLADGMTELDLRDFIAEQGTEVIFRLDRPGRGTFDFGEDTAPRYDAGLTVDFELCLADAEHRATQWAEIEEVIPGVSVPLRMARELPEGARDVTVTTDTWRLLAALGGTGTVEDVSHRVGTTDFKVARALSTMVRQGLLEIAPEKAKKATFNTPEFSEAAVSDLPPLHDQESDGEEVFRVSSYLEEDSEDDEAELLQSLLTGMASDGDSNADADDLEIVDASDYDDSEGSLSERAAGLMRRRGLGAAYSRELNDDVDDADDDS